MCVRQAAYQSSDRPNSQSLLKGTLSDPQRGGLSEIGAGGGKEKLGTK